MQTNCVKLVDKLAQKYVKNTCNKNVQKLIKVEKLLKIIFYSHTNKSFKEVLQILNNMFCTINLNILPLLNWGFTLFPHRSTITTTLLIKNKEETF